MSNIYYLLGTNQCWVWDQVTKKFEIYTGAIGDNAYIIMMAKVSINNPNQICCEISREFPVDDNIVVNIITDIVMKCFAKETSNRNWVPFYSCLGKFISEGLCTIEALKTIIDRYKLTSFEGYMRLSMLMYELPKDAAEMIFEDDIYITNLLRQCETAIVDTIYLASQKQYRMAELALLGIINKYDWHKIPQVYARVLARIILTFCKVQINARIAGISSKGIIIDFLVARKKNTPNAQMQMCYQPIPLAVNALRCEEDVNLYNDIPPYMFNSINTLIMYKSPTDLSNTSLRSDFASLTELTVTDTKISAPFNLFTKLSCLTKIDFSNVSTEPEIHVGYWTVLPNLEEFRFAYTPIYINFGDFVKHSLPNVSIVWACHAGLVDDQLVNMHAPKLVDLILRGNNLTKLPAGLSGILKICMHGNLTDIPQTCNDTIRCIEKLFLVEDGGFYGNTIYQTGTGFANPDYIAQLIGNTNAKSAIWIHFGTHPHTEAAKNTVGKVYHCKIPDSKDGVKILKENIDMLLSLIAERKNIIISCDAGISRSRVFTIIALKYLSNGKITFDKALDKICNAPCVTIVGPYLKCVRSNNQINKELLEVAAEYQYHTLMPPFNY